MAPVAISAICSGKTGASGFGLEKIIITGANGVGKSHFASRLASARPEVPVIAFDAIKLRSGWQQRPRSETERILGEVIRKPAWILEGGPSLLRLAADRADALVWLDPPEYIRAWQLAVRPWKFLGRTRPEIGLAMSTGPGGNINLPCAASERGQNSANPSRKFSMPLKGFKNGDAAMIATAWKSLPPGLHILHG